MNRFVIFMQENWGWIVSVAGILGAALGYTVSHIRALQRGAGTLYNRGN